MLLESGTAELIIDGETRPFNVNEVVTIYPPTVHRVKAISDIVITEVLTPEVDDVIRVEDDTNRESGKIDHEHFKPAVCILAAGYGTRLGKLAENTNKTLLPVDNKAILSHIIELIPPDFDIIIAIGHHNQLVREYCEAAHFDRIDNITFIIDHDIGEIGHGPAHTLALCKNELQRPFYICTSDTLLIDHDQLDPISTNWLGITETGIPELYSTVKINGNNEIIDFMDKSVNGHDFAFIGLTSIYDYEIFWNQLDIDSGELVSAFYDIAAYPSFYGKLIDGWYDTGTIDGYIEICRLYEEMSLPKNTGQFIYYVSGRVIKTNIDALTVHDIIQRSDIISETLPIPELVYRGMYTFAYEYVDGMTLYQWFDESSDHDHIGEEIFTHFLYDWGGYIKMDSLSQSNNRIHPTVLNKFYFDKTLNRVKQLIDTDPDMFCGTHIINGHVVGIDILDLIHGVQRSRIMDIYENSRKILSFHGDFQPANIIWNHDTDAITYIDWRPNFGKGVTEYGDLLYDLAKMYGGLIIPYDLMKTDDHITLNISTDNKVEYEYPHEHLTIFKVMYECWLVQNGYNLEVIKLITAFIFLSMSPLHSDKFSKLLFCKGKEMLYDTIDK